MVHLQRSEVIFDGGDFYALEPGLCSIDVRIPVIDVHKHVEMIDFLTVHAVDK